MEQTYGIFNNEERVLLNGAARGEAQNALTRQFFLETLSMGHTLNGGELGENIAALFAKIERLTDEEVRGIAKQFPLAADYGADDEEFEMAGEE
jgi:hypothetical protein